MTEVKFQHQHGVVQCDRQIIQMTFRSESLTKTKVKASLESLLVPEIILQKTHLDQDLNKTFGLSDKSVDDLLSYHPDAIRDEFKNGYPLLNQISESFPSQVIEHLSLFKSSMKMLIEKFKLSGTQINYSNPLILNVLNNPQSLSPLYPKNDEIYIEFHARSPKELNAPLIKTKIKVDDKGLSLLELSTYDSTVASIYTDEILLLFIKYILDSATHTPISDIIQGLQIPSINEMKKAVLSYSTMKDCSEKLLQEVQVLINSIIQRQLSK